MELSLTMFWLLLMIVLLIIEGLTSTLVTIWFAFGALFALLFDLLGSPIWLQITIFLFISLVTLLLTRPIAKKYLNGKTMPTNADRFIGEECIVVEEINAIAGTGAVKVSGQTWTARSLDGSDIPVDTKAIVRQIDGVKLIVEPTQESILFYQED